MDYVLLGYTPFTNRYFWVGSSESKKLQIRVMFYCVSTVESYRSRVLLIDFDKNKIQVQIHWFKKKIKFIFIGFEKIKFKFIDYEKTKFKLIKNSWADSNSIQPYSQWKKKKRTCKSRGNVGPMGQQHISETTWSICSFILVEEVRFY